MKIKVTKMVQKVWLGVLAGWFVLSMIPSSVWAMAPRPQDPNAPPPPAWIQWTPMLVMVLIFYFLLIRPQMQQRKQRQALLNSLKKGDKIITQGGLLAMIVNVGPQFIEIKLNDQTRVKIQKSGISDVINPQTPLQDGDLPS